MNDIEKAKPLDPEGVFFSFPEIFESIDDKVPEVIRFEIERTMVDEVGWSSRAMVDSGQDAIMIYTASLDGGNSVVGRLVLSPRRFDVSSEMAHNLYVRYTRNEIVQFFFHHGWSKEGARYFVRRLQSQLLSVKAWNPRYKMTVGELVGRLKDIRLGGFWEQFKNRGNHG